MSKIIIPIEGNNEDAKLFVRWLNEHGHSATVGSDAAWYIDGVNTLDDKKANETMVALCDEYHDSFPPEFNQCESPETRFYKVGGAAENWLLEIADKLLTGEKIPAQSRIALGQALRDAALTGDGMALLKALGMKKGGGEKELEQAARAGATNEELAVAFNVGKNEVPKKIVKLKAAELAELDRRLSHTVGILLRAIEKEGQGASTQKVVESIHVHLQPQFRMLTHGQLEDHVTAALKLAVAENLIASEGSTITLKT